MVTNEECIVLLDRERLKADMTESHFCRAYTIGYLCAGNSAWDLIDQFWDCGHDIQQTAFHSLKEIADDLTDDPDQTEDDIKEAIEFAMQAYNEVRMGANSTIVG